MPSKYRSTKNKRKASNSTRTGLDENNRIKLVAGIAGFLILLVIGWAMFQNQEPPAGVPTSQPAAKRYSAAPEMMIDVTKEYFATVQMAKGGEFVIQLYPDKAPITVNSFVFLAREKYFDGVTFHRVLDGFMSQGGDPAGTGTGGPGYSFVNEDSDLQFDKAGVVAMANAGRNTNGSQFFITFAPVPRLNGDYTIFGQVVSGMDVVNNLTRRDPDKLPNYPGDAILTITISEK
jgi:cyclophilin family peptidyl-prolyl cis-trans isomerase